MNEVMERPVCSSGPIKDMALFNALLHPLCTATTVAAPYSMPHAIDSIATTATEHLQSHENEDDEVENVQNEEDDEEEEEDDDEEEEEEEPSSRLSSEGATGNIPATPSPPASESTLGAFLPSNQCQNPASQRGIKRSRASTAKERISKMPPCAAGKRSSIYRGVTRHRWTGRYEAHLWDKTTWNQNQNKKGKQVYLGAYDDEEAAARAYDLAALKYWGPGTLINFPVSDYARDIDEMQGVSREDYLATLRRKSSGFSRGASKVRGNRNLATVRWDGQVARSFVTSLPQFDTNGTSLDNAFGKSVLGSSSLINLCHFMNWLQPPNLVTETTLNKSGEERSSEGQNLRSATGTDQCFEEEKQHPMRVQECYEPYKLPSLGLPKKIKKVSGGISAMTALSQSSMFTKLEEKFQIKKSNESPLPSESVSAFTALEAAMAMLEYEPLSPCEEKKNIPNTQSDHCNRYEAQKPSPCTALPVSLSCAEQKMNQQQIEHLKKCGDVQTAQTTPPVAFAQDQATYIPEQIPSLWNGFDPFMNLHLQYSQPFHT